MENNLIVITIVVGYLLFLVSVGIYSSKKIGDSEDFLVAGRRLGPFLIAGTLAATEIGGGSSLGVVEKAYGDWGISSLWYVATMGITFTIIAIVAPMLRGAMVKTIPEFFRRRYDKPSALFTSIIMIMPLIGLTAVQFIASGVILSVIMGWDYTTSVIIISSVVIIYSMLGGLWSVSLTDFAQMLMIVFGMLAVVPFSLNTVGGLDVVIANTPTEKLSMTKGIGWPTIFSLVFIYTASFICGQEVTQRLYAAKSGKTALIGSLLTAVVFFAFAMIPALLGIITRVMVDTGIIDGTAIIENGARYALPTLASQVMPPVLVGILFAGISSATMSSASSDLLGAGSIFANDLYKIYINPEADQTKLLLVARITIVVIGLFAIGVAVLNTSAIISILMFSFSLRAGGTLIPYLFGHFYPKGSRQGTWASLLLGTLGILAVQYEWINFFGLDGIFLGLLLSVVGYFSFSYLFPNRSNSVILTDEVIPESEGKKELIEVLK
ncbi:sodium:solute symporter family protein [Vibrio sp. SS-MA-C1-2]|uniref:sodium:solute symporter family protein n=1 Tax=Vibrio sp. SS-MA-C1-2 TaxID=2908646 RepID=UPI001F3C5FD1|nr:sodium:solute symporter family protein [Vibrio sp. SS-MA-C1-2]UJF17940.1 sodium:solute symporter family protein [Vibrio sp. SS-MA-C1-2]